jgi:uncharacterized protein
MKELVLITGASGGIGRSMAVMLAEQGYDLVLVARNSDKLQELSELLRVKHGVTVHVIAIDLAVPANAHELYRQVTSGGLTVTMLVNNAGVGLYGDFLKTSLDAEIDMINLNVTSVVILTKLFGQDMKKRGRGRILNVASLLSFLPFPYYAIYSATKSFVLAFTETIAAELEDSGVVVTALCPGPVDTGFHSDAMWNTRAYESHKPVNVEVVAGEGVKLLLTGRGKKIVGFNTWFISNLPRITPDRIMMKIKKRLASQRS